ncbi:hypothetical protein A1A1_12037 [Planococcus antarcticus DSM 14505]|uniref:Uncharacterized protein n=1 Tax=Planococcus antarcticus DSM 14505 TaxID=1185653 RepID=A0A1C7DE42_9BACL|nr:hypothetical protein [Planococcus antarcticus]ANU09513.1 hypothetical protein BBH88_03925 [Planococcus antarcticus DSM 14505]EIM06292.1 hypothetical protein A1A1_12037 [Planococcus antarcticus DSM 14505]
MILILGAYIALLSFSVYKIAGNDKERWINAGYLTAFVIPLVIHFLILNIVGAITGAGIGASATGLLFAVATSITGFVFLYIGYVNKTVRDR